ncbi:hypothetical protein Droror1_Dr00021111 [Drosera rotundifolia]
MVAGFSLVKNEWVKFGVSDEGRDYFVLLSRLLVLLVVMFWNCLCCRIYTEPIMGLDPIIRTNCFGFVGVGSRVGSSKHCSCSSWLFVLIIMRAICSGYPIKPFLFCNWNEGENL